MPAAMARAAKARIIFFIIVSVFLMFSICAIPTNIQKI